jgi:hypothetical protein
VLVIQITENAWKLAEIKGLRRWRPGAEARRILIGILDVRIVKNTVVKKK